MRPLVGDGLAGGGDADGGRGDDALELGMGLEEADGLAVGLVGEVVAVDGRPRA